MSLQRLRRLAALVGALGLAAVALHSLLTRQDFALGYLFAWFFWLGVPLGALSILMLHRLTGGAWGRPLQGVLGAAVRTLPWLLLLFLPLLFQLATLYPWADPLRLSADALLQKKQWYLNEPFFLSRIALYFLVWLLLARAFTRLPEPDRPGLTRLAAAGQLAYGVTITFAAVDLIMSLQPHWYSTSFGLLVGVSQLLSALAFGVAVIALAGVVCPHADHGSAQDHQDFGNLLLMLVMVWAYLAFTQFLIIWYEDLPHEIAWYIPRLSQGWQWVGLGLVLFHFTLPLLLLLFRGLKRRLPLLGGLAAALFLSHAVDVYWMVVPGVRQSAHWSDLAALLGIGGVWLALFLWQLERRRLRHVPGPA